MKAFSLDLRERIVAAVNQGLSKAEAARLFQVSRETVKRLCHLQATAGSLQPKIRPGLAPRIPPEQYPLLAEQLRTASDATLEQHCQLWSERHHQTISPSTLSRTLKRMGWSRKKKVWWRLNETSRPAKSSGPNKPL